jgi:hypothetical protein
MNWTRSSRSSMTQRTGHGGMPNSKLAVSTPRGAVVFLPLTPQHWSLPMILSKYLSAHTVVDTINEKTGLIFMRRQQEFQGKGLARAPSSFVRPIPTQQRRDYLLCSPTGPNLLSKWMRNPSSFLVASANLPSIAKTPASLTRKLHSASPSYVALTQTSTSFCRTTSQDIVTFG